MHFFEDDRGAAVGQASQPRDVDVQQVGAIAQSKAPNNVKIP